MLAEREKKTNKQTGRVEVSAINFLMLAFLISATRTGLVDKILILTSRVHSNSFQSA
jgi:hypothetical protein